MGTHPPPGNQPASERLRAAQERIGTERFRLVRELGYGGFGAVYEAVDQQHPAPVALKLLHHDDAGALYRFKQEFRLLTMISHEDLVTLHELFSQGAHWFFTMDLIDGHNFLEAVRGMPVHAAFLGLARGLRALHEANIVHLDLKPQNVRVTPSGRVVVLDFGLARPLARAHAPSMASPEAFAGSPLYMAPEQWWHKPLSESTDWYAVGVMLYEALTGRHPFKGRMHEMLQGHRRAHAPVTALAADAPPDLAALCEALLRYEPDERPSGDEVLRRLEGSADPLGHAAARRVAGAPRAGELVGRAKELCALRRALERSLDGHTVLVRVHGAAGMGKTALLRAFADELSRNRTAEPLTGRCCEREWVPYKALDGLVDDLCHTILGLPQDEAGALLPANVVELARLFPVVQLLEDVAPCEPPPSLPLHPREIRSRAAGILQETLRRLGARRPLVLLLDDLQWGDVDSVRLLAEVLSPPHVPAMLLVLAYRSDEADSACLSDLQRMLEPLPWTVPPEDIALGPLSPEDANRLIQDRLGNDRDTLAEVEIIARESAGDPLLIEELVRYVSASLDAANPVAGVELSLDRVIGARVAELPEDARALLEVVAVAGQRLEQHLALEAVSPGWGSLSSLARLRAAHLLRPRAVAGHHHVEISHDRIRACLMARIDPAARAGHHRRLAAALEALPEPPPDRIALHLHGAGELGRAACYALRAAERAREALAFAQAAAMYGAALEWSRGAEPDPGLLPRREITRRRAEVLALCGCSAEAAPIFLYLVESALPDERADLERLALEHFLLAGQLDQGLALAKPALARVGLRYPESPRAAFLHLVWPLLKLRVRSLDVPERSEADIPANWLARIDTCWTLGKALADVQPLQATGFQLRSLILALDAGEPSRMARALIAFGSLWLWQGTAGALETGTRYIARGCALARRADQPELEGMSTIFLSARAVTLGDWSGAVAFADRGLGELRRVGREAIWEGNMARLMALLAVEAAHRARAMRERAAEWVRVAADRGDLFSQVTATLGGSLGLVAAGEPGEARRRLWDAIGRWPGDGTVQHASALPTEVYADLYEDRAGAAFERITAAWPRVQAAGFFRALIGRMKYRTARALVALALAAVERDGRRRIALIRGAEEDAARLSKELRRDAMPIAHLVGAGAAWLCGDEERALRGLVLAERGFDAAEMHVHAAAARLRRGEIIGGNAGRALVAEADARMKEEGIRDPGRWAATIAPGFSRVHV